MAELTLAGLTLTQEEWDELDEDSRILILEALSANEAEDAIDDPYESYEVYIEELPLR